jgi:hypothetical protein
MMQAYNKDQQVPKTHPSCYVINSKKNPLTPIANEGWEPWSWKDKHYLVAKKPGAKISFEVDLVAMGVVMIWFQRSKIFGLGDVMCWLDDRVGQAEIFSGYWEEEVYVLLFVSRITP